MDFPKASTSACYLLFAYDVNYPQGGIHDLLGMFSSQQEAKDAFDGSKEIVEIVQMIYCLPHQNQNAWKVVATGWAKPNTRPVRIVWTDV